MKKSIAIIGLGYVGLPLAVEFAKQYKTLGFDIKEKRILELNNGTDSTLEVKDDELQKVLISNKNDLLNNDKGLYNTTSIDDLIGCNFFIITVPTPTDKNNRPNLSPLIDASVMIGNILKKGDYVIYESTVYPGVTEDECVPILEKTSNLKMNQDFFVGYSPERIVPGDKNKTITKIKKVTSGSSKECAQVVDGLYKSIIKAGTHLAPTIKIAEASKAIENSQRDINIAFVNELAKIFNKMNIDTKSVLEAAGTKWNFLPFKPGLVGGHCIGVDPYYLAQKSQESGYYPEIILAGRRINDSMGEFVSSEIVKTMIKNEIPINKSRVLILGFSFKENCPDFRNTKVIDIYQNLIEYDLEIKTHSSQLSDDYNVIVHAVSHDDFKELNFENISTKNKIIYDVKGTLPDKIINSRL